MKINKLKLLNDIEKAMPGIASGTVVIENADSIVFYKNHIYTYNSAVSVCVCDSQESNLNCAVKGIDFYNCLKKLPNEEIEIESTTEQLIIRDGKIKVKVNTLPIDKITDRFDSLIPSENWNEIDGKDFQKALKICTMSKNTSKFAGIYHDKDGFLSTDSYVINTYKTSYNLPDFWIADSAVAELRKWDSFTHVQLNKMWLQFKSVDETIFSVRCLDISSFPIERVKGFIDRTMSLESVFNSTFTTEFYEAVTRASVFSGESDGHQTVEIKFTKTGTTIASKRISGEYEETVENVVSENEDFDLMFDVSMILESAEYFSDFKLIKNGALTIIMLENETAHKVFSNIIN